MKFWKKYKAKKELRKKLEKARFVNFYGEKIDLSLGRIKELVPYNETTTVSSDFDDDYKIREYYIILNYDNFVERYLFYEQDKFIRDNRIYELKSFGESDKFTEYLNNYENLKKEYEQL